MEFDIIPWNKWRKLNQPRLYEVEDGVFQWKESIRPTLLMNSFEYIGAEETNYEIKDQKS